MARSGSHARRKPRSNPRGVLDVRSAGFGFVKTAEGEFFVPASRMGGAFDGDLVEVAPLGARSGSGSARRGKGAGEGAGLQQRPEARVVRVIDRAHDTIVGRYEVAEPFGVVVPEDPRITHDIFTMRSDAPQVPDGSIVRVRITTFPGRNTAATGVIEEVIGTADDDVLVDLIVARHKIETAFSDAALAEAAAAAVDVEGALAEGYRDLRDRLVVTVDPADARDFDDAVSLESLATDAGTGRPGAGLGSRDASERRAAWRLGVHIADVSRYVPWGSSIDLDARRRATSVYLVDRVIPMLPEALSNDICSLRPGVPRLAMTVDLYLDDDAGILSIDAYPAVIESKRRFSYDEVQTILEGEASSGSDPIDARIDAMLGRLSRLAKKRAAARTVRGGLDFETTEAKVRLDADGAPVGVDLRRKTDATELIEESMILGNETVATFLENRHRPGIFRVHEQPSPDALAGLVPVFQEFPWWADIDADRFVAGDPSALQDVLAVSAGRAEGELVSMLVLRAQKRAVYKPACEGHYGLALGRYAHFTSPIRRYPDLVIHRMLKAALCGEPDDYREQVEALPWLSEHSSEMERIADAAARESQECKIIELLTRDVGRTFSAVVSGVVSSGLYARLDTTAEGFLPARALGDDYFAFDPVRRCLEGVDTGRRFRLGQRIAVVLHAAEPRTRTLEFRLAKSERGRTGRRQRKESR